MVHISTAEEGNHNVYGVIVEYYDPMPLLIRQYVLKYFANSQEVEMVDNKSKRLFLKRTACPDHITIRDLFVGNRINLFGRILTIIGYSDPYTRSKLQPAQQPSVALITPDAYHVMGQIIDGIVGKGDGLQMSKIRMVKLSIRQAEELTNVLTKEKDQVSDPRGFISSIIETPLVALAVIGDDCIARLVRLGGELRAKYGASSREPAILCAQSEEMVRDLLKLFFDNPKLSNSTATFDSCTCGVVRPHAIKAGHLGKILDRILSQGYEISAMASYELSISSAMEFLEVYKDVVPEYKDMAEELTEGSIVALEIRAESAVETFRETVGPWDIEIAKEICPATLRAEFGLDRVRNAVHCTDLPEDGELECRYFFELCAGRGAGASGS